MTTPQPFILFVLGGPGAGKGTQCTRLVEEFNFVHLSAGDLLREEQAREGSEFSELIGKCIKEGSVVPVEVTLALLKAAMERTPDQPFLIDGYPRAMSQAEEFEKQITACKAVLYFRCTEAAMRERLLNRGKSSGRSDDNEESIVKRFVTFNETSYPVIQHYQERNLVIEIDTVDTPDNVYKVTREAVAKLLNKESPSEQIDAQADVAKEAEVSNVDTKKSKKKNKKKKNKGSVSSLSKASDNDTDKETTGSFVGLSADTFTPIETIQEVAEITPEVVAEISPEVVAETSPEVVAELSPEIVVVPSVEEVVSQPDISTTSNLESAQPEVTDEIKDVAAIEIVESTEAASPIEVEDVHEVAEKSIEPVTEEPIVASGHDEINLSAPVESIAEEKIVSNEDLSSNVIADTQELQDDNVPQVEDIETSDKIVDSVASDLVQEHVIEDAVLESDKVSSEIHQDVIIQDIPAVVDQDPSENILSEQQLDSQIIPAILEESTADLKEITPNVVPEVTEELISKPESLVNEVEETFESLSAPVASEIFAAHAITQELEENFEESFTIPAIPTQSEIVETEVAQELLKENTDIDILGDIPSQSEDIVTKVDTIPSIPEEVVTKSDDFLGSFAEQFQFSDFKAPETNFDLPNFNNYSSKSDIETKSESIDQVVIPTESDLSSVTEKLTVHAEPSVEAVSDKVHSIEAQVSDNLSSFGENIDAKVSPIVVPSVTADLSDSIDENKKQAEIAITNKFDSVQEQAESQVAPTLESIQQKVTSQPEEIQSSLVKEIPAEVILPISSTDGLEKISKPELAAKDTITSINSQVSEQVTAINSNVTDQISSVKLSESIPINEDSTPQLPTPATLSEKVRDIPLSIPDSHSSTAAPTSVKSKSKKKSGCSIM